MSIRWYFPASYYLWLVLLIVAAIVAGARPSVPVLALILVGVGLIFLLRQLQLALFALVGAALLLPLEIGTGTEVSLNAAALAVPAVSALWLVAAARRRAVHLVPTPANRPLLLFLLASLLSLVIGTALWDPAVSHSSHFLLVQLAQWALFAFSAGAFWLGANLIQDEQGLRRLTFFFLALGGVVVLIFRIPSLSSAIEPFITVAFIRVPFWMMLTALAAGQLLFNEQLSGRWRLFLIAVLGGVLVYAFAVQMESVSNWLAIVITAAILVWLRWPRWRVPLVVILLLAAASGLLLPAVYTFAGGDTEWSRSGGARVALITRVLELTWSHNPITGLGPAAYRPYGYTQPLVYGNIVWLQPRLSSHNNYVDLFAHAGIVGLALFLWFCLEIGRLGLRVRRRVKSGFAIGYANGMVAAGVAAMAIMFLADWVLPYVYNIGFPGFQASVLLWLFMGGLVVLEEGVKRDT
jgi:O-antigen ligase